MEGEARFIGEHPEFMEPHCLFFPTDLVDGSWANFTPDLFALVATSRYLVSTDGSGHRHRHARTLNYVIGNYVGRGCPELVFNYRTAATEAWALLAGPRY